MIRRTLVLACATLSALSALSVFGALPQAPAGAAVSPPDRIGPDQVFTASVNGSFGIKGPATIRVACLGPVRAGATGHPNAGQTVEAFRPEVVGTHHGFTGPRATSIVAFFGAPPPGSKNRDGAATTVTFHRYGTPGAIPTSLVLPCSGTGQVSFVPLPMSPPTSTDLVVPVVYVGQP